MNIYFENRKKSLIVVSFHEICKNTLKADPVVQKSLFIIFLAAEVNN